MLKFLSILITSRSTTLKQKNRFKFNDVTMNSLNSIQSKDRFAKREVNKRSHYISPTNKTDLVKCLTLLTEIDSSGGWLGTASGWSPCCLAQDLQQDLVQSQLTTSNLPTSFPLCQGYWFFQFIFQSVNTTPQELCISWNCFYNGFLYIDTGEYDFCMVWIFVYILKYKAGSRVQKASSCCQIAEMNKFENDAFKIIYTFRKLLSFEISVP